MNISLYYSKQTCYSHNNNGVLYLHLCSKTNSGELSLRFVVFTNSTQIFREHVISGLRLSLSLRFVSNHQPRLSFYRLVKVMPKLIKFKGQRSQDKIRHISLFDEEQNVLRENANFVYEIFVVSCFGESMLPFGARAGNLYMGRTPPGSRPVINISPGTLQGSARARKGSRPAPMDTVRIPLYIYLLKSAKEIARCPAVYRAGPLCNPPGFSRIVYGLPV